MPMGRRTSVILDDELMARAQAVLGTSGIKDTIDAALREAVRADQRRRMIARIQDPDGYDDDALLAAEADWFRTA
jgi:Arc/MetJ family transcription regulator